MEKIDLYNTNKEKLGKIFTRNRDVLLENEYYLLPQAWIINNSNEIFLTRRSFNKSYGGMWEPTSGHVKAGETSLEAIKRELLEEIRINNKRKRNFFSRHLYSQALHT